MNKTGQEEGVENPVLEEETNQAEGRKETSQDIHEVEIPGDPEDQNVDLVEDSSKEVVAVAGILEVDPGVAAAGQIVVIAEIAGFGGGEAMLVPAEGLGSVVAELTV